MGSKAKRKGIKGISKKESVKKIKCYCCNTTFLEPKIYYEHHPYGMGYATEEFVVCPHCGNNFEEATQCKDCGEWFFKDELTDGVCEDCDLED